MAVLYKVAGCKLSVPVYYHMSELDLNLTLDSNSNTTKEGGENLEHILRIKYKIAFQCIDQWKMNHSTS